MKEGDVYEVIHSCGKCFRRNCCKLTIVYGELLPRKPWSRVTTRRIAELKSECIKCGHKVHEVHKKDGTIVDLLAN